MTNKKAMLLILDGWGHGPNPEASALAQANTPFMDSLYKVYPNSELITFGEEVGLPEGQMGNSEVGHLNIGAGRIVYQELARINKAIREKTLDKNEVMLNAIQYAKENDKAVHLLGLVSDGGVHSHVNHLLALCGIMESHDLDKVFVHAFMDGRDTSPNGGIDYMKTVSDHIQGKKTKIASVIGRYYAMDRDKRWERIKLAYDLLVNGVGEKVTNLSDAFKESYDNEITDEFIKPMKCVDANGNPIGKIESGDVVLFYNFRTDRPRELTTVLTQQDMPEFEMKTLPLHFVTMTRYDETYKGINVMFNKDDITETLGEIISKAGRTQVRLAETEKYPHVTFFFNGGREAPFENEKRLIVASPKVATYDLQPEMSALEVTDTIVSEIENNEPDFVCLNYANTDMVGHTGVFAAAVKAAETVDNCVEKLVTTALEKSYSILIIADHGNSDCLVNEDGTPHTAHTTNPVPCILVKKDLSDIQLKKGKLADVAPTILALMEIEQPSAMTGENLMITSA